MKKIITPLIFAICFQFLSGQEKLNFPSMLEAKGKKIDITSHTAPCIYDFNKDGVDDLIVGDFGDVPLEGMENDPVYGRYVQGRCHIFINHGTNSKPIYTTSQLLMANKEPAFVPITCCIGFTPRFVDIDNDGLDDIISGSYPGEIYLFKGLPGGLFDKAGIIMDNQGDTLNVAHSIVAEPFDYDNDGDIDLIISTRMNGTFVSINLGNMEKPSFAPGVKIDLQKYDYVFELLNEPRKSHISHAFPTFWDEDNLFDLVCGTEQGHLIWYKNTGTPEEPKFSTASTLFTSLAGWENVEGDKPTPLGVRVKVFVNDYNGDGKKDILAGDFYSTKRTIRELTPEEEMEWDTSKNRRQELLLKLKEMFPDVKTFRKVAFLDNFDGLSKREIKKVQKITIEINNHKQILDKYQDLQEFLGHGYVWLFTRQ
ncbi:MAG: VCBS repeat-containing protein [Bacteroidales bacterium]|nr:VCBS repeat-containing protein [Bacteroidales bacterium]